MLNQELLTEAEGLGKRVRCFFEADIRDVDLNNASVKFIYAGKEHSVRADLIVGADGASSAVRTAMLRTTRMDFAQHHIDIGYKEILLPAGPDGQPLLSPHHLHIWPRGDFMMIALPNEVQNVCDNAALICRTAPSHARSSFPMRSLTHSPITRPC
jgi:kynurenine 3-monooxygenase